MGVIAPYFAYMVYKDIENYSLFFKQKGRNVSVNLVEWLAELINN